MTLMSTWRRHGTKENDYAVEFYELVWIFIIYAFYRLVY